jgi:hypothetical protein
MTWKRNWRNKYSNVKSVAPFLKELSGRSFDSKLERDRAVELVLLLHQGLIRNLQFQQTVYFTDANIGYRPDFQYEEVDKVGGKWRTVYEEAKGMETDAWMLKRKLWRFYGLGFLRITKRAGGRIRVVEEITPKPGIQANGVESAGEKPRRSRVRR